MPTRSAAPRIPLLAVVAAWLLGGCGSTTPTGSDGSPEPVEGARPPPAWVEDSGSLAGKLAAVGAHPCGDPRLEQSARILAERDGRAKLAYSLRTEIRSLVQGWSRRIADLMQSGNASSATISAKLLERGLADVRGMASKAGGFWRGDRQVYVLVVLDRPGEWVDGVARAYEETVLGEAGTDPADGAAASGGSKRALRERLEAIREEAADDARQRVYRASPESMPTE